MAATLFKGGKGGVTEPTALHPLPRLGPSSSHAGVVVTPSGLVRILQRGWLVDP